MSLTGDKLHSVVIYFFRLDKSDLLKILDKNFNQYNNSVKVYVTSVTRSLVYLATDVCFDEITVVFAIIFINYLPLLCIM